MKIKLNFPKDNNHIYNLAFVKALLIHSTIDNLNITYLEKEQLQQEVLEYLKKTWTHIVVRVTIRDN